MRILALALTAAALAAPPANRSAAQHDAGRLLALVRLPAGATSFAGAGLLRQPYARPATSELVDLHRTWRVPAPLDGVVSFVQQHRPPGSRSDGSGEAGGPGTPANEELTFAFPPLRGITMRELALTAVSLGPRTTGLRVDAEEVWVATRPPSERIPAGVREVDVVSRYPRKAPLVSVRVRRASTVAAVVRRFDALGIVQPGSVFSCPAFLRRGPTVTFDFRAASGALLARAGVLAPGSGSSGPCNAVSLSIRGRRQTPLIGGNVLVGMERLLGVRFR